MAPLVVGLLALTLLAAPLAAEAQPGARVWRIGLLCAHFCDSITASLPLPMTDFTRALHQAGYVDGKNVLIDYRGAGLPDDQLARAAAALVQQKVDIIARRGVTGSHWLMSAEVAASWRSYLSGAEGF